MIALSVTALILAVLLAVSLATIIGLMDERDAAQAEARRPRNHLDQLKRSRP